MLVCAGCKGKGHTRGHMGNHKDLVKRAAGFLRVDVDGYYPEEGEEFDPEAWEGHQCCMDAPALRSNWKILYRIGRALIRHGRITLSIGMALMRR